MSWRLRLSVEPILRLTPAVLGSTVFSIARVVRCPRVPRRPGAAGRARGHRLQLADAGLGLRGAAFVVFVVWQRFNDARGFVKYALHGTDFREIAADGSLGA